MYSKCIFVEKNNCMKTEQVSIGKLIADEVRKQGISITDFAEKICCRRNNVYRCPLYIICLYLLNFNELIVAARKNFAKI